LGIDQGHDAVERKGAVLRELDANNDSRKPVVFLQSIERSPLEVAQRLTGRKLPLRVDALQSYQLDALRTAEKHRIVENRRNGNDVRHVTKPFDQIPPVFHANAGIFIEDIYMRGGSQHVALKRILKSVIDRQGNDQGHHSSRDADH